MIDFKKATLDDENLIAGYFKKYPSRSCERTFSNIYLWSREYPVTFAVVENTLVFKREIDGKVAFTYPAGEHEDVKAAVCTLHGFCEEKGVPIVFYMVTPPQFEEIESLYPGKFEVEYLRDIADYVYEREKLATLAGKKLHGKRNHINRFLSTYEGRWSYERLSEDNVEDCFQMAIKWGEAYDGYKDREKNAELTVAINSLRLFKELRYIGGVLRVDGEVVAFTSGEEVTEDTIVVHIEKAMADIEGAYPMINQQFVKNECEKYTYVNREDDAGVEGLRKAKLSYRPAFLVEKGEVRLKGECK
ncbi:MAG: DUF2156 domain-containing protein [Suipraeoptans sp.]